tara:strand:+ start:3981 stop:5402 length:1422 start_codon:yes stop_codon:yes gene_type:complete
MINYDDRTSKILDKIQNLSFTDLIKTFNNIDSKNDIKISDYYKKNDNINELFKVKTYKNEENSVLDIPENAFIPVTGKIELDNFKNSKQLGVLYFNYNNGSTSGFTSGLNLNSILSQYTINDCDIIKIIFSGNQIYSNNPSTGAININVGNFSNCMYLNLYLETFVTGCHGKPISGSRKNASGNNGGNGESSNNAGDGIVLNGSGSTNLRINIQKNSKLSGGFGGNGGAGGRAGRSKINTIAAVADDYRYRRITGEGHPSVTIYNRTHDWDYAITGVLQQVTGSGASATLVRPHKWIFIKDGRIIVPETELPDDNRKIIRDDNEKYEYLEKIDSPDAVNKYYHNRLKQSNGNNGDLWKGSGYTDIQDFNSWLYSFKHVEYTMERYLYSEGSAEVPGQDAISAGDGSSGSFADSSHNSGNPFPSLYSSSSTRASNGDAVPTGSRQAGITGTGGAHGIDGLQIKNLATNITLSHY